MTLLELGHLNIQLCVDGYATVGGHDAGTAGVALPQQEGSACINGAIGDAAVAQSYLERIGDRSGEKVELEKRKASEGFTCKFG
uniref:Uncharacterized protein n=1 Tax=Oryza nivara TaxID=4536 RepID=A0A0E0GFC0_ORYNI